MKKLLFIFCTITLASCVSNETANSDTVKQTEIYQGYTIKYDAGDMELSATAFFRFGGSNGTTLNLVKPSTITLNGQEMAMGKNIFSGTFYESNVQSDLLKSYTFVFTDTEKKTYTNTASIEALSISDVPAVISKKSNAKISWTGEPIQAGERVYVTLEGKDFVCCTNSSDLVGANSIEIPNNMMKDLKPGEANIILKREKSNSLKEATHLGGNLTISYTAKKAATKVED